MQRRSFFRRHKPIVAALASVLALSGVAAATLGGFSATIVNPTNTFASGTLQLEESDGGISCYSTGSGSGGTVDDSNSATCSTINKLGAALDQVPAGTPVSTTVTMTNVGNLNADTAALQADACTASAASDNSGYTGADLSGFCGKVDVTIDNTTSGAADKCLFPTLSATDPCDITSSGSAGTLASLASTSVPGITALTAGQSNTYKFTVMLDPSADNSDQGLSASLPLTWTLNAGSGIPGGGGGGDSFSPIVAADGSTEIAHNLLTAASQSTEASAIDCNSPGDCTAVGAVDTGTGNQVFAATETDGTWGPGTDTTTALDGGGQAGVSTVSCASPGNCTLVGYAATNSSNTGYQSMSATETDGVWAPAQFVATAENTDLNGVLNAVSCTAPGYCVAGGSYNASSVEYGFVITETDGTWGTPVTVTASPDTQGAVEAIACTSTGTCTAAGQEASAGDGLNAFTIDETDGSWSAAEDLTPPTDASGGTNAYMAVSGLSCPTAGNCSMSGIYTDTSYYQQDYVVDEVSGVWGQALDVTSDLNAGGYAADVIDSISCPTPGNCTMVGTYTDGSALNQMFAATETDGTWAPATELIAALNTDGGGWYPQVSCTSPGNCDAITTAYDTSGYTHATVVAQTAGAWDDGTVLASGLNAGSVDYNTGSTISCPAAGYCTAAGQLYQTTNGYKAFATNQNAGTW